VSVVLVALSTAATVDITGNGLLYSFPISISGSGNSGLSKLPRILYDNVENVTQDRRFRLINQGSTVTVTVDSTKTSGASSIEVSILMRQFLGR
jgi:L-cysteine desulfidase